MSQTIEIQVPDIGNFDSVDVIANLESPAPTMRALAEIDAGRLVGKDLEGIRGWFEVPKLSTGIAGSEALRAHLVQA